MKRKILGLTTAFLLLLCSVAMAAGADFELNRVEADGFGLPPDYAISGAQARLMAEAGFSGLSSLKGCFGGEGTYLSSGLQMSFRVCSGSFKRQALSYPGQGGASPQRMQKGRSWHMQEGGLDSSTQLLLTESLRCAGQFLGIWETWKK